MRLLHFLIVAVAACGDDTVLAPDAAEPRERIVETKSLIGSEIAEATLVGGPGDRALIRLAATAPSLDWNLHGHAGGSSQTIAEAVQVMAAEHDFVPPAGADWSLLLRNHSAIDAITVDVTIDLYGEMTWAGWQ